MLASVHSPTMTETIAAKMRMRTSGLLNWFRNRPNAVACCCALIVFSPYCLRRCSASAGWRPLLVVRSAERSCSNREAPISPRSFLRVLLASLRRCTGKEDGEGFHSTSLELVLLSSPGGSGRLICKPTTWFTITSTCGLAPNGQIRRGAGHSASPELAGGRLASSYRCNPPTDPLLPSLMERISFAGIMLVLDDS